MTFPDIRPDDLTDEQTRALLALHLAGMHADSPPDGRYALDVSGLQKPDIAVWTVWHGDTVVGVGALRNLGNGRAEIKSMRTHPQHLRRGIAAHLLDHLIDQARSRGMRQLSLETGSGPAFDPAHALYRGRGFIEGDVFGDYRPSRFNRFFHLAL